MRHPVRERSGFARRVPSRLDYFDLFGLSLVHPDEERMPASKQDIGRRQSAVNWVFDKNDPSDEWPAPADGILAISPKLLKKLRGEI